MEEKIPSPRNELFLRMITAHAEKEEAEQELYKSVEGFFTDLDEDVHVKMHIDEFGYIRVNISKMFDKEVIEEFEDKFDFTLAMFSERDLTDYRNPDEVIDIKTYQYVFTVDFDVEE